MEDFHHISLIWPVSSRSVALSLIDLIAATTNALNGALLAQRPDYYRGRQWSVVGILILAVFGGIGGGRSRVMCC